MAIDRTNRHEQLIKLRINVVVERSPAFFVLIVFTSWGIPINIPVADPIQLNTCDHSMILTRDIGLDGYQAVICISKSGKVAVS